MSEAMRGSRLGAVSHELDRGPAAATVLTTYICACGLSTTLPFAAEADEIPVTWECSCGRSALRQGVDIAPEVETRKIRSHYDMLLERRSIEELAVTLDTALGNLRGSVRKTA